MLPNSIRGKYDKNKFYKKEHYDYSELMKCEIVHSSIMFRELLQSGFIALIKTSFKSAIKI